MEYASSPYRFAESLRPIPAPRVAAVLLATVLITATGMDFHDYIRRARSSKDARFACGVAAIVLFALSFLPASLVSTVGELPGAALTEVSERQKVPYALSELARESTFIPPWMMVWAVIPLAIGPGAAVLRVMRKTVMPSETSYHNCLIHHLFVVLLTTLLCASSATIIDLIVEFYAVYISAIIIPLIAYISEGKMIRRFNRSDVVTAAYSGAFFGIVILVGATTGWIPISKGHAAAAILVSSSTGSCLVLALASRLRTI